MFWRKRKRRKLLKVLQCWGVGTEQEKFSKPPRLGVGEPPRIAPQLVASMHQGAIVGERRVGPLRTTADSVKSSFGKFLAKWIFMTIPPMKRKCESPRIYW